MIDPTLASAPLDSLVIRPACEADVAAIAEIYNYYVRETVVTFEETEVPPSEVQERMADVANASLPWLVALAGGELVGYAYATRWKGRSAYRFSVETTVYLKANFIGRGIGAQLYMSLLTHLREASLHTAIGGIALPNPASEALHQKLGFRKVAQFAEVGFKFGRWIDVGYWQLTL